MDIKQLRIVTPGIPPKSKFAPRIPPTPASVYSQTILPSKYLYEKYDLDVADRLHMMELDYLMNGGELSKKKLKWAKENVPNIKEPNPYFRPLIDYLEENGIKFKERKGR